jgi:hypothetical protein
MPVLYAGREMSIQPEIEVYKEVLIWPVLYGFRVEYVESITEVGIEASI